MRILITVLLLLLAACQNSNSRRGANETPSELVRPEFKSAFRTIAPAEYLGDGWAEYGGSDGVRRIWAASSGDRALVLLRGSGAPALWIDRERSLVAQPVSLEERPLEVDAHSGIAYYAQGSKLFAQSLPDGSPELRFGSDGEGDVIGASTHPQSKDVVWILLENFTERNPAETEEPSVGGEGQKTLPMADVVKETHGEATETRTLTAIRLSGEEMISLTLPAEEPDAPVAIVALPQGRAAASIGNSVFLLDPDTGAGVGQQIFEGEREVLLAADMTMSVIWVYIPPLGANSGTGRSVRSEESGRIAALDLTGGEYASIDTGLTRFSQLTGDWSSERALLARDGAGVLLADHAAGKASWILRNGGDVQMHLLAGGAQLWAILPDGIAGILANKLVNLGPQLIAAKVLPREQIEPVRTAVEALGWDWKSTVISPLSANVGRFTLFESVGLGSELAELDWSPSRKHVCRLLAARSARSSDAEFAALSPDEQRTKMVELLTALGWPNAVVDEARTLSTEIESAYTYVLQPDPGPGCSAGEFSLWQGDSVLLTLDAPTAPLPADVIALEAAGAKALEEIITSTVAEASSRREHGETDGGKMPPPPGDQGDSSPKVHQVYAGWVLDGDTELLPEAEGNALPVYEVHLRSELPECRQYRILLNARTGDVLARRESNCSPLHIAGS